MAMNDVRRGNDAGESEQHKGDIIFNIDTVLGGVQRTDLQAILDGSATFFLLQNTLTTYQEANKKLYGLVSTHISNALLSRSTEAILAKKTENNYKNALASPLQYAGVYSNSTYDTDLYTGYLSFPIALYSNWVNVQKDGNVFKVVNAKEDVFSASVGKTTVDATTAYSNGLETLIPKYDAIITTLGIENASLPSSPYASWSEHLNPAYAYNADKATSAIANGLYMAINKYLSSTELTNGIKIYAGIEYAKGTTAKPGIIDGQDETTGLAKFKTKYAQLEQAAASFVYSNKLFTNDTPLSFYTNSSATMDEDTYFTLIKRLGTQSTTAARKINRNNDDLVTYWTFIDTLQYLVKDDYANLMKYLQTSVMSYGVEADLVWVAQDDRNANPSFMNDTTLTNIYGWKQNYMGKYDGTYLHNRGSTGPSSYIANSAYSQSAPLKYGASSSMMGMGFAGLATSSSSPSSITTTLQNALFTDTYRSKTDSGKTKHYGGWFKYGSMEKLETYINKLSSVADIQKLATNLGAANEDPLFTSHVLDVVKRTTFQDGDPEITAANTPFKVGQALSAEVLKNRLLGVKNAKYGDATVNYVTAEWGLNWYCYVDPSANPKVLKDEIKELFTRFGGADLSTGVSNGIAQELYDVNSGSHAMPSTSDASTASQYARMMVIQLNYDDFQPATISGTEYTALENLCYALGGTLAKKDAANFDTTLLN